MDRHDTTLIDKNCWPTGILIHPTGIGRQIKLVYCSIDKLEIESRRKIESAAGGRKKVIPTVLMHMNGIVVSNRTKYWLQNQHSRDDWALMQKG